MNNTVASMDLEARRFSLLRMLEPGVLSAPYEHYHAVRAHDPVYWDRFMHAWVVTSYKEVSTVLLQYSAERTPDPAYLEELELPFMKPFAEVMLQQMMFMDGANHSRLRSLCAAAFTPRRIQCLRDSITSTANRLLDKVLPVGSMDLVADFASPLPALVTAQLLGIPEEHSGKLHHWVLDIAEVPKQAGYGASSCCRCAERVRHPSALLGRTRTACSGFSEEVLKTQTFVRYF